LRLCQLRPPCFSLIVCNKRNLTLIEVRPFSLQVASATMTSRSYNFLEDSFTSVYPTGGRFRGRSRADKIHHGRSGIDRRRYHSLGLESANGSFARSFDHQESRNHVGSSSRQRKDALATQTKTTSRNQEQFREEFGGSRGNESGRGVHFSEREMPSNFEQDRSEQRTSTKRGIVIDFENEEGNGGFDGRTSSRRQNERFLDGSTSLNTRPQRGSSYYNDVFSSTEAPFNSFSENTSQSRRQSAYPSNNHQERDFTDDLQQQTSMHTLQPNILREEVVWQPVKVIYVEKTPRESNRSGTAQRQGDYSSSSYGHESRQAAPRYQQSSYSNDWGGSQRSDGHMNRAAPPDYETSWNGNTNGDHRRVHVKTRRTPPSEPREGSNRRSTEMFQSRDDPSASDWNGGYQTVKRSPQRNDFIDGVSSSRSWASNSGAQGGEYGYPTRTEHAVHSQNGTLSGMEGLNRGFSDQGNGSFTYRRKSRSTPRLLQNTGLNGSASGVRSQGRQVHIAHDDELSRGSRLNLSRSSGLELNGERSGGFREEYTSHRSTAESDEKEFVGKLMKELENQRQNLKPEVDRLIRNSSVVTDGSDLTSNMNSITLEAGKNSYIDTSLPTPVFKAYVDVKEYSPKSVKVNYDHATNKIIVEAGQLNAQGTVGKTFTQKIALPKYADDLRLTARMNSGGILRIEVPLLFYFPEEHEQSKARSFLYEATGNRTDGTKALEIIVKPGADYSLQDIRPEVIDSTLMIWGGRGKEKKVIGKYVLPPTANIAKIKHRSGKDGSLSIIVPIT